MKNFRKSYHVMYLVLYLQRFVNCNCNTLYTRNQVLSISSPFSATLANLCNVPNDIRQVSNRDVFGNARTDPLRRNFQLRFSSFSNNLPLVERIFELPLKSPRHLSSISAAIVPECFRCVSQIQFSTACVFWDALTSDAPASRRIKINSWINTSVANSAFTN